MSSAHSTAKGVQKEKNWLESEQIKPQIACVRNWNSFAYGSQSLPGNTVNSNSCFLFFDFSVVCCWALLKPHQLWAVKSHSPGTKFVKTMCWDREVLHSIPGSVTDHLPLVLCLAWVYPCVKCTQNKINCTLKMTSVPQARHLRLQRGKKWFCGCQSIETLCLSPVTLRGRLNLAAGAPPCTREAAE